jgi:sulfite reductase (NADPH) flavoprotein alpha-component
MYLDMKNELNKSIEKNRNPVTSGDAALHVIYGSRTGNSLAAATLAWEYAQHLGIRSFLHNMKTIDPDQVRTMNNVLIAVSTHGEGDPPAVAERFYDFMHSDSAPSMENSRFSILALGDSSYRDYCKTGHDFRNRLLKLGGKEISPLEECDIDYEENAKHWVRGAVGAFAGILSKIETDTECEFAFELNKMEAQNSKVFYAKVKDIQTLTHPDYEKRTIHLVLSMEKFGAHFQPGDSFGIYAQNSRLLVDHLLKTLHFDGTHAAEVDKKTKLLKEALISDFELTVITPLIVKKYAELTDDSALSKLLKDKKTLDRYCETHDVLDLVSDFPSAINPVELTGILRRLNPRLYSVANSLLVHPDEVHFTVGLMEYDLKSRRHSGVCSTLLSDRVDKGATIPVFLESNEKFRIPDDDLQPIIMIATGTGIAPFRGFLQERDHKNARGENWLFFGDRYAKSDFLYRDEIVRYHKKGLLTKLNTAFSRDQEQKVYVQHHLLENSSEIFSWIHHKRAVVYICGNKRTMGEAVKKTLEKIIRTEGNLSADETKEYIQHLKTGRRWQTDLY